MLGHCVQRIQSAERERAGAKTRPASAAWITAGWHICWSGRHGVRFATGASDEALCVAEFSTMLMPKQIRMVAKAIPAAATRKQHSFLITTKQRQGLKLEICLTCFAPDSYYIVCFSPGNKESNHPATATHRTFHNGILQSRRQKWFIRKQANLCGTTDE